MSLFKIENIAVTNAVEKSNLLDAPKIFPKLFSAGATLAQPVSIYETNFELVPYGTWVNTSLENSSQSIYCNAFGNVQIATTMNITVPSATKSDPVFLSLVIYNVYDNSSSYYNYCYNNFKVDSSEPQTFTFTNYFQNTWGDLYTYFYLEDPLYNYPSMTVNSVKTTYVAVDSLKADAGQFYID